MDVEKPPATTLAVRQLGRTTEVGPQQTAATQSTHWPCGASQNASLLSNPSPLPWLSPLPAAGATGDPPSLSSSSQGWTADDYEVGGRTWASSGKYRPGDTSLPADFEEPEDVIGELYADTGSSASSSSSAEKDRYRGLLAKALAGGVVQLEEKEALQRYAREWCVFSWFLQGRFSNPCLIKLQIGPGLLTWRKQEHEFSKLAEAEGKPHFGEPCCAR